jgi:tyrosine-protein phosphatase SIW14
LAEKKMMNSIKYYTAVLMLTAIALVGDAFAQVKIAEADVPNFHTVNANLYRGAQLNENGVKQLAALGVKTIIDLRGEDATMEKEKIWARSADVRFVNIPLSNWFEPSDAKIAKILSIINDASNQPVFVHCKRGADRTGTIIAVYRITHDGWTAKQASAEAKSLGFGWWQFWMKDYIEDYYEDYIAKNKEFNKAK